MEILYGFLILGGIGLAFGALLAIFSKILYVKEDERINEVEKLLPNYNCGSCGYAGCHEMASKIVNGEEKNLNKCKPGKKDKNFDPILAYLSSHPNNENEIK